MKVQDKIKKYKNLTSVDLLTPRFDLKGQISFWQPGDSESMDHSHTF